MNTDLRIKIISKVTPAEIYTAEVRKNKRNGGGREG